MTQTIERHFVPQDFDPSDFANIEPLGRELRERPIESAAALELWLLNASELTAAIREHASRLRIDYSCHTDDEQREKAYLAFVENVAPKLKPMFFALQRKYIDSPGRAELERQPKYRQLAREWQAEVEIYRDANVPLQTEITKLNSEYDKLCGAMTVEFEGRTLTLQQMARYLEEPDRDLRRRAFETTTTRRLEDRAKIDELLDAMIERRQRIAANAEFDDFRAYTWKNYCRFDYTPDDCHAFADAVEQVCVPILRQSHDQRAEAIGLDRLRPWDTAVDPKGRPALRPFNPERIETFFRKTMEIFQRVDPRLATQFGRLEFGRNLDLNSRKGKQPGGYQSSLEETCEPFIFMNAAGLQRDVETLLHEGGHAFHFLAAAEHEPLVFLRHAPIEFCEVASMSMELLAMDHLEVFYDSADADRARRRMLEDVAKILPWIATIDQFQHWLYTHPDHTRDQRTQRWIEIFERFSSDRIDWTGCEDARAARWQAQMHLFHAPFYYIEYGIAQLGALQVWQNYQRDPKAALAALLDAFALGGTRPLPELFETAGIRFDFSRDTIEPLMHAIRERLEQLPV